MVRIPTDSSRDPLSAQSMHTCWVINWVRYGKRKYPNKEKNEQRPTALFSHPDWNHSDHDFCGDLLGNFLQEISHALPSLALLRKKNSSRCTTRYVHVQCDITDVPETNNLCTYALLLIGPLIPINIRKRLINVSPDRSHIKQIFNTRFSVHVHFCCETENEIATWQSTREDVRVQCDLIIKWRIYKWGKPLWSYTTYLPIFGIASSSIGICIQVHKSWMCNATSVHLRVRAVFWTHWKTRAALPNVFLRFLAFCCKP